MAAPLQPFCTSLYPSEYFLNLSFNLIIYIVLDGPPASVTRGLIEEFLNDNDVDDIMYHRTVLLIGRRKNLNVLLLRRHEH